MSDGNTMNGQDALVITQVLNTLAAVLQNGLSRGIATSRVDPLSPTPFGGSATGAIEAALANMSTLSFTQEEIDAVQAAIAHATEYENRVQQATGRAIQVMGMLKPLIIKLIPLIV